MYKSNAGRGGDGGQPWYVWVSTSGGSGGAGGAGGAGAFAIQATETIIGSNVITNDGTSLGNGNKGANGTGRN